MKKTLLFLPILVILISCSSSSALRNNEEIVNPAPLYYEIPAELRDINKFNEVMSSYSEHLNGVSVFIDPGHGGSDRSNVSRNGKLVEADLNLNVSLYLREFLLSAGAAVFMSRTKDTTVTLEQRIKMANESRPDIFISIHHNAAVKANDNWTNYTVTFYHADIGDYKYEPFEHTLARYVQRDLAYAMRNSGGLGSFDGTQSDYRIYPGEGFALLKENLIPSILVECSFFTNRLEEQRLAVDEFNRIEGWGIFQGIAKLFSAGVPEFELIAEKSELKRKNLSLYFDLNSEVIIDDSSIRVYFDEEIVSHTYDLVNTILSVKVKEVSNGEHDLKIELAGKNGIYAFPYHRKIVIN